MKRTHVVIASEARQSSSTCRTLDCRVALFLIETQKRPPVSLSLSKGCPFSSCYGLRRMENSPLDCLAAAQDKVLQAPGNGCY
jgi:hypothetical protein